MIGRLILIVFIITIITLLVGFFSNEALTSTCSNRLLDCLSNAQGLNFGQKLWEGLVCVCSNVVCVFKQIIGIFK